MSLEIDTRKALAELLTAEKQPVSASAHAPALLRQYLTLKGVALSHFDTDDTLLAKFIRLSLPQA